VSDAAAASMPASRTVAALLRVHDRLTEWGVRAAMAALALIVAAFTLEVVARYGFDTPTRWTADLVSYLLLFVTFMAVPHVTATGGHVAVTALLDRLPVAGQRRGGQAIAVVGAAVCALLTWITLGETIRQASSGVRMMAAYPVPKAWISMWIVYGLASSGLHFLRLALWPPAKAD
jgi:TRAP-type C4-dicarboxylate transport system permease small subunit